MNKNNCIFSKNVLSEIVSYLKNSGDKTNKIALKTKLSKGTISNFIDSNKDVSCSTLFAILNAYDLRVAYVPSRGVLQIIKKVE